MWLSGELMSVSAVQFASAVGFLTEFEETSKVEMFVQMENCVGIS